MRRRRLEARVGVATVVGGARRCGDGGWRRTSVRRRRFEAHVGEATVVEGVRQRGTAFGGVRRCGTAVVMLRRLGTAFGGARQCGTAVVMLRQLGMARVDVGQRLMACVSGGRL